MIYSVEKAFLIFAQEFHLRTPRVVLSNQRTSLRYLANQESPQDARMQSIMEIGIHTPVDLSEIS